MGCFSPEGWAQPTRENIEPANAKSNTGPTHFLTGFFMIFMLTPGFFII
jgi:hypothetical protein